jgi:hypothetical protein
MRRTAGIFFVFVLLLAASSVDAANFDATLDLSDGSTSQTAHSGAATTGDPLTHRAALTGSANATYTMKWKVVRSAKDEAKDVLVHAYVVKMDKQGQAPPALEPSAVVIESAISMDFPPGEVSSATQPFHVDGPGVYLIRIEAGGDPDKPGSADFAEIELVVK